MISQEEEQEKTDEDSKELEETREVNHDLKTHLKEAKRIEEILKIQLEEKEETIQKLEIEVVGLRKKGEKNESFVKFKDSSVVLDKILDCQRSPLDKTGLGYKNDKKKSEDDIGLRRLQKQVHQRPKLLPMHVHMTMRTLEVQR